MNKIFSVSALVLVAVLAGCAGLDATYEKVAARAGVDIYSSPQAIAMRGCADGADIFTRGMSPSAIPGLLRGSASTLGDGPVEAMSVCLEMLRSLKAHEFELGGIQ